MPLTPWAVLTTDPKNVEHVLRTNFDNYPKGPEFQNRLAELLGGGIFNTDGAAWHSQRKISSHMFTANMFKEHIWVVVRRNARMLRNILESSADTGRSVDIFNLMNRFTLDTIGEIGFGRNIGSLEDPTSAFLKAFDRAQQISFWRFLNPLFPIFRFLEVGPEAETRLHFGRLDDYSRTVVRELRDAIEQSANPDGAKAAGVAWADQEARKSFVGLFMEEARRRGETYSEDYLRDLVLNFLIAGRDTTAQALSWTIFCLIGHPDVEEKARKEAIEICGIRGPAYEDMPKLSYLQAVISEALRLYPSVPVEFKYTSRDDTWPDGAFVPAGTTVMFDIYGMGRDTSIWGADAREFRPERWLEMARVPDNYQFPVFNAGPRECLGRRLAMIEMKTCLATLLPQFSFRLTVPADEIVADTQLTLGMGRGLPCTVCGTGVTGNREAGRKSSLSSGSTAAPSEGSAANLSDLGQAAEDAEAVGKAEQLQE